MQHVEEAVTIRLVNDPALTSLPLTPRSSTIVCPCAALSPGMTSTKCCASRVAIDGSSAIAMASGSGRSKPSRTVSVRQNPQRSLDIDSELPQGAGLRNSAAEFVVDDCVRGGDIGHLEVQAGVGNDRSGLGVYRS